MWLNLHTIFIMKLSTSLKRNLKERTPRWVIFGVDVLSTMVLFGVSYFVVWQSDWKEGIEITSPLFTYTLIIYAISFFAFQIFRGVVRHIGVADLLKISLSVLIGFIVSLVLLVALRFSLNTPFFQRSFTLLVVHFLLTISALVFLRVIYKQLYQFFIQPQGITKNIVIYGAGVSGITTLNTLRTENARVNHVVSFIDDNIKLQNNSISGVRVLPPEAIDEDYLNTHKVDDVVVAIQNISNKKLSQIIERFEKLPVKIKIVPPIRNWINGNFEAKQIKKVKIEDLLGRIPIQLEKESIRNEVSGKTILITGAAGSIGSEISRQLFNYPCKKIVLFDKAESDLYNLQQESASFIKKRGIDVEFVIGDARDYRRVETIFNLFKPELVFHAAAYKHVPLMEDNPYEAVFTNIKGTKQIADAAIRHGATKFVMVSTDKAVNPTNVMGATKRIAELYVNYLSEKYDTTGFVVTRFGNVLGSSGSVIPLFKKQILNGGPLTATHPEVTRFFMTIPEACQLVLEAGAMGVGGEIYVFDMGESMKIFDLAKRMIKLSGLRYPEDIDIEIVGLRPGEKIYEELLADGENTVPTYHEKIMIAHVAKNEIENFEAKIDELINMPQMECQKQFNLELVSRMKELVPEYISQNSTFETLDEVETTNPAVV